MEMGGISILRGIFKTQKFTGEGSCHMGAKTCNVEPTHDCRQSRVVYKATCLICQRQGRISLYFGTTGCTLHKRTLEHQEETMRKSTKNAQSKHHWGERPTEDPEFETTIVEYPHRFNLERYISESIQIEGAKLDPSVNLVNQRSEWGHTGVVRLGALPPD